MRRSADEVQGYRRGGKVELATRYGEDTFSALRAAAARNRQSLSAQVRAYVEAGLAADAELAALPNLLDARPAPRNTGPAELPAGDPRRHGSTQRRGD